MPFKPGQSGNPHGRPPIPEIQLFREALAAVEKDQNKSLLRHAVERAFKEDAVLIALLRKMLPDKIDTGIDLKDLVVKIVNYADTKHGNNPSV